MISLQSRLQRKHFILHSNSQIHHVWLHNSNLFFHDSISHSAPRISFKSIFRLSFMIKIRTSHSIFSPHSFILHHPPLLLLVSSSVSSPSFRLSFGLSVIKLNSISDSHLVKLASSFLFSPLIHSYVVLLMFPLPIVNGLMSSLTIIGTISGMINLQPNCYLCLIAC